MTAKSPFQITTQLASKNVTLSADTAEELAAMTKDFLDHGDFILENLTTLDQIILAKAPQPQAAMTSTHDSSTPAARSVPPPSGDRPSCPTHGPAKDMAGNFSKTGKPYKHRWYCPEYQCSDFNPRGDWVA